MKVNVKTNSKNYDVVLEKGGLENVSKYFNLKRKVLIVTDNNIPHKYIDTVYGQSKEAFVHTIVSGEKSKNFYALEQIFQVLVHQRFTRKDVIVAIGGGVVGDLTGLAASLYMRGIDFYNIPTSLLAMVDSSIGGKTAVDFYGVKNIIGTFYQPTKVLIDTNLLKTLDKRNLHSGLVEALKMGLTHDKELVSMIENSNNLLDDIDEIINKSLLIKKSVVEEDEKESGLRRVLNFGHTIGHAIESIGIDEYIHGECVGIGMLYMSSESVKTRILKILKKYDLPTETKASKDEILNFIRYDKKADGDFINIVKVNEVGSFEFEKIFINDLEGIL